MDAAPHQQQQQRKAGGRTGVRGKCHYMHPCTSCEETLDFRLVTARIERQLGCWECALGLVTVLRGCLGYSGGDAIFSTVSIAQEEVFDKRPYRENPEREPGKGFAFSSYTPEDKVRRALQVVVFIPFG